MHLLQALHALLGGHSQQQQPVSDPSRPLPNFTPRYLQPMQHIQPLPQVPMGQDPKNYGYPPDITYNPNPHTNIPYSSHNPALLRLLGSLNRPGLQTPANIPIGGFQTAANPQQLTGNIGQWNNNFRDTRIGF